MDTPRRNGCLISFFVVLVLLGFGGYMVWKHYLSPFSGAVVELKEYADSSSFHAKFINRSAFVLPADGRLRRSAVARFADIADSLNVDWRESVEALHDFDSHDTLSFSSAIDSVKQIVGTALKIVPETRRRLVRILNRDSLPLGWYRWVKWQTLAALRLTDAEIDSISIRGMRITSTGLNFHSHKKDNPESFRTRLGKAESESRTGDADSVAPFRSRLLRSIGPAVSGADCD
jgi:hypothetical protein